MQLVSFIQNQSVVIIVAYTMALEGAYYFR